MTDESQKGTPKGQKTEPVTATVIPESDHPIREHQLDREALKVLYRLRDAGFKGYLVGGGVRDLYLGRAPKDFDISTDARPGQLRQLFRNSRTIGRRFRLVQVFFRGNKILEVSTLRSRSEFDMDGDEQVLPSNNTFGTLEEDAFRRDLTINSLFYEIENHTIIDYTGGVQDLDQGIIRMVGDPDRRFIRDPVRMMRVIRHAARTGFTIDDQTMAALQRHKEKLHLCPASRIRDEVLKDLQSGASLPWMSLCLSSTLFSSLFPWYKNYSAKEGEAAIGKELMALMQALDQLQVKKKNGVSVKVPEPILLAALVLPWACRRFNLPETNVRGQRFHRLSRHIREDIDRYFGEPFNVQRMAKESMTTLLINLSTFYHARKQGADPKWLKRKSYYNNCSRFYDLYLESQGVEALQTDRFIEEEVPAKKVVEVISPVQQGGNETKARGRCGLNPAFSSKQSGVFGLRRQQD